MGGAFVAIADDPNALISNPAGLALSPSASLTFTQSRLSFDTREYLVLATARPFFGDKISSGFILTQRSQDNVSDYKILLDANGNPTGVRVLAEVHTPNPTNPPPVEIDYFSNTLAQIELLRRGRRWSQAHSALPGDI